MSSSQFLNSVKVLDADPMTATVSSSPVNCAQLDNVSFQAIWTAGSSPVGVLSLEGSNNYNQPGETAVWSTITLSATLSISGSSGSVVADANQASMEWLRVTYTRTSGSGTLNVWAVGKES